jgi:cytochrome c-type biogenesis protein CcmH
MTTFIAIALALAVIAAACVAWPLWRGGTAGGAPSARVAAGASVAAVLLGGSGLYATWSDWNWDSAASPADTPVAMVASLARRLEREPEDLQGWLMLGRSYSALEQYPLAARAYQRADRLSNGRNAEALTGWAEALTLGDENELQGRAGRLFEQALALDPKAGKALFFGGIAAQRRGELPLARQRFAALLEQDPPPAVRPILEQQLVALDAAMAQGPPGGGATAAQGAQPGATGDGSEVRLTIALDPALASRVPAGAVLFVLVRQPNQPGPPLAAKRLAATFPQDVVLTPADAMLAGRSFAAGDKVEVMARVALGGTPTAQSGDPSGQVLYEVGKDQQKRVLIDRLAP